MIPKTARLEFVVVTWQIYWSLTSRWVQYAGMLSKPFNNYSPELLPCWLRLTESRDHADTWYSTVARFKTGKTCMATCVGCNPYIYVFDCIILKENSFLFWTETAYQRTCWLLVFICLIKKHYAINTTNTSVLQINVGSCVGVGLFVCLRLILVFR